MQKIVFYHISRADTLVTNERKLNLKTKKQKVGPKSCTTIEISIVMSRQVVPCFARIPHKSFFTVMFYCARGATI